MADIESADIREATDKELRKLGWRPDNIHGNPAVIDCGDGRVILPARDPELNGQGHLVEIRGGDVYSIAPEERER